MTYEPTIGLEIHAELKTRTKMFCDSLNDPDEKRPNTNVCPVCLGHPGTLPVANKKAIESVIKVGLALGGEIAPESKFDRKNYFYPDLPKGYQISQYDKPIVKGGELKGVRITRVHLEEDTGRLLHGKDMGTDGTLIDFNRAGVPLMELVTEPDIRSAEQAVAFAKELQLILQYLGVSDANMDKGQMRVEVNISMNMGTKVEIKNINSFRAVEGAIAFEIERQTKMLETGEKIKQETRGTAIAGEGGASSAIVSGLTHGTITVSQRTKEDAHDYRYFPEPDLPPFETEEFGLEELKNSLPELPREKRGRFEREFALNEKQIEILIQNKFLSDYFERAVSELATRDEKETSTIERRPKEILFNYLTTELVGLMNEFEIDSEKMKIEPESLAELIDYVVDGKVTTRQAKDILRIMFETGERAENVLGQGNFGLIEEDTLHKAIEEVLHENEKAVADFASGKAASLQFLVGKVMAKTKGGADPGVVQNKLLEKLQG